MPVKITDPNEMEKFVRTHLAHRLTSLLSPICRKQDDPAWVGEYNGIRTPTNDTYRAAKEGSYVMLRLFIEFMGVIGDTKNLGKLKVSSRYNDDLRMESFNDPWGVVNLKPSDFRADEAFVAQTHRTLCKINSHFTYDVTSCNPYDRIASLGDKDWEKAVKLVLNKLDSDFYQKVGQPVVVHQDFKGVFMKMFPAVKKVQGAALDGT